VLGHQAKRNRLLKKIKGKGYVAGTEGCCQLAPSVTSTCLVNCLIHGSSELGLQLRSATANLLIKRAIHEEQNFHEGKLVLFWFKTADTT